MNTRRTIVALAGLAVALAGCESASPGARPGPYVKPGLIMVPADQARFYGVGCAASAESTRYAPTDVRSVQTDATISAVQFNRYADPARPEELMHEAHVVYRREAPARWKLQPSSADQQIIVGPSLTDGRGEVRPLASQELDGYIREQRAATQRQQQALGQLSEGVRQLADQQQQLAKELTKLRSERAEPPSSAALAEKPAADPRVNAGAGTP